MTANFILSLASLALLLAKSMLIVCLAFGGSWLLRRHSGATRHGVWLATMVLLIAVLAVAPYSPWHIRIPPPSIAIPSVTPPPTIASARSTSATVSHPAPAPVRVQPPSTMRHAERALLAVNWTRKLLFVWWIGIAFVVLRQIVARIQLSRLSRRASETDAGSTRRFEQIAHDAGIGRPVALLVSDDVDVPLTWGMFNARVLLPKSYTEWEHSRLENVMQHELAHVRRLDAFTALVADVACALYWYNPLVWLAATQMRLEREIACDEAVLASGARASDYATDLLDLAVNVRFGSLHRAGLAIAGCPRFEHRVRTILNGTPRTALPRIAVVATVLGAVAVLPLAAFQVALSQRYPRWPVPPQRVSDFHHDVMSDHFDAMVQQATSDPSLINARGQNGQTALSLALVSASHRHADEAWWLIMHGADVNAQESGMGMTALMHAVTYPDLVKLMLERGAKPNVTDLYERTALDWAAIIAANPRTTQSADLLLSYGAEMKFFDAVLLGRTEDVKAFLDKDPGLITSTPSFPPGGFQEEPPLELIANYMWRSPQRYEPMLDLLGNYFPEPNLRQAIILGRMDRVQQLVDADRARIDEKDQWRETALGWAVVSSRNDIAKFLMDRGAQPSFDQLTMAVHGGNKQMVELLLSHDVPRSIDRYRGGVNSALLLRDWAANNGHPDIAELLSSR